MGLLGLVGGPDGRSRVVESGQATRVRLGALLPRFPRPCLLQTRLEQTKDKADPLGKGTESVAGEPEAAGL